MFKRCCQTTLAEPTPFQTSGHFINMFIKGHFIIPLPRGQIATKRYLRHTDYSLKLEFEYVQKIPNLPMVSILQFVLCTYDGHKWVGIACEVDSAHKDTEIKFMHPTCPSRSYNLQGMISVGCL